MVTKLLKSKGKHMTCNEIYDIVKEERPSIGLSTVYRTVAILEELGVLRKAFVDDKCMKYEVCVEYAKQNHFHLICKECGAVIEVKDNSLDILTKEIYKNYSFEVTDHRVNFFGICSDCSNKSSQGKE